MTPKKFFYGLVVSLVLVIAGSGAFFWYARGEFQQTLESIKQAKLELSSFDHKIEVLLKTGEDIKTFEQGNLNLDAQLPSSKSQSDALKRVVDIFERNDISITSVSFLPTEGLPSETSQTQANKISSIYNIPIEISTSGDSVPYGEFREFLEDLERSERHLNVRSLTLSSADNGEVNYTVSLVAHFLYEGSGSPGGTGDGLTEEQRQEVLDKINSGQ